MITIIRNVRQLLEKYSSGKNVLLLFVITQLVYLMMLFYTIPNVTAYAYGMKILDLMPTGYSAGYVKELFDKLGPAGRDYYLFRQLPLDMIYPFLFMAGYSLLLTYLFKKSFKPENKIHSLAIIPLFGGFFDYLENVGIIYMLNSFPNISTLAVNVTNLFSILKSVSTTIFFVLLFVGIACLINTKFRKSGDTI